MTSSPWKRAMLMNDTNYLPIVPIFQLMSSKNKTITFLADSLTFGTTAEKISGKIEELNKRKNVQQNLDKIRDMCDLEENGKACVCYGRILEFGSYNVTENITEAYKYYTKAQNLNETSALPMLSFYHRYYQKDIESSIIEASASTSFVESSIPASIQHYEGKYRPKSCPAAARKLKDLSEAVAMMNDEVFHTQQEMNETEYKRLKKSSDPKDQYKLAVYQLSQPYMDNKTLTSSIKLLNKSYENGYSQAGAPLARLQFFKNPKESLLLLRKFSDIGDPIANYAFSEIAPALGNEFARLGLECLKSAVNVNSLPAIHKFGEITYYGLGVTRSAKDAYKIFSKGAVLGYKRSIYKMATMLLGGDGATVDCPRAVENLRKITDLGPWSSFFDRYVARGSEVAYLKMIDLGLTPCKFIPTNRTKGYMHADKDTEYLTYIRNARQGDDESIVWLALKSPLNEAEEYLLKLRQLKTTSRILELPIRAYLTIKNFRPWLKGELNPEDAEFISSKFGFFKLLFVFTTFFVTFMLLVIARVRVILE